DHDAGHDHAGPGQHLHPLAAAFVLAPVAARRIVGREVLLRPGRCGGGLPPGAPAAGVAVAVEVGAGVGAGDPVEPPVVEPPVEVSIEVAAVAPVDGSASAPLRRVGPPGEPVLEPVVGRARTGAGAAVAEAG